MKKIKIGQIGIGHNHGGAKMLAVRKFPELFEIVGWAEENERWVEKRGSNPEYADLPRLSVNEIIKNSDAVMIETDVWHLTETAQKCVDAGKHVHMDKPAGGTLEEYRHLLDTAQSKGLILQLAYMYRYNPAIQKCLEMINDDKLGEIYSINAEMSTFHPIEYKKWLTNFNGGIMYILGSHLVDLIVYILGKPQKITSFMKSTGLDGINFEDNTLAVLEYEKALARVFVSSVEVNGFGRRQFTVSGSNGTFDIRPMERPLTVTWSDRKIADKTYEDRKILLPFEDNTANGRYDEMMKDFHAYITGKKENPYSYGHEYAVQEVLSQIICGVNFNGYNID